MYTASNAYDWNPGDLPVAIPFWTLTVGVPLTALIALIGLLLGLSATRLRLPDSGWVWRLSTTLAALALTLWSVIGIVFVGTLALAVFGIPFEAVPTVRLLTHLFFGIGYLVIGGIVLAIAAIPLIVIWWLFAALGVVRYGLRVMWWTLFGKGTDAAKGSKGYQTR
jgi:hypothetical protein